MFTTSCPCYRVMYGCICEIVLNFHRLEERYQLLALVGGDVAYGHTVRWAQAMGVAIHYEGDLGLFHGAAPRCQLWCRATIPRRPGIA